MDPLAGKSWLKEKHLDLQVFYLIRQSRDWKHSMTGGGNMLHHSPAPGCPCRPSPWEL